ncbi:hypothetical protein BDV10DRAFT_175646 [Aspergillus recurvatus]
MQCTSMMHARNWKVEGFWDDSSNTIAVCLLCNPDPLGLFSVPAAGRQSSSSGLVSSNGSYKQNLTLVFISFKTTQPSRSEIILHVLDTDRMKFSQGHKRLRTSPFPEDPCWKVPRNKQQPVASHAFCNSAISALSGPRSRAKSSLSRLYLLLS